MKYVLETKTNKYLVDDGSLMDNICDYNSGYCIILQDSETIDNKIKADVATRTYRCRALAHHRTSRVAPPIVLRVYEKSTLA